MRRGTAVKQRSADSLVLERKMVTHHDVLTWDLDRCVGCQLGPHVCPKEAITHLGGAVRDGRLASKLLVDVDPAKCVFCGMCVVMCPVHAISMTLNDEPVIPVQAYEAFPELVASNTFEPAGFDWSLMQLVLDNCPTEAISYVEELETLEIDEGRCIHCRQCEVASDGAFEVVQPWEGTVVLRRERCVEGCLACADICPTQALRVDDTGELVLSDYYCIKCGACVQVCPVAPAIEEYELTLRSQGVTATKTFQRVANSRELPIWVERWRVKHTPVQSGAWVAALVRLADEKAGMLELEHKRAIKRRDLIVALKGGREAQTRKAERRAALPGTWEG